MRAVVLTKTCLPEELKISEVIIPKVISGWVLIKVKAFGLNHSEVILRRYEANAPYIQLPRIPGIECVGEIVDAPDGRFSAGQRVCGLMGGMGRSFDGSYAEYVLIPEKNVFAVQTDLDWIQMAAVPETWFTAWGSLFDCLQLNSGDTLLVHGGTSALGIAAMQIARSIGCHVLATTRKKERQAFLQSCGAVSVLDNGALGEQIEAAGIKSIQKVLELVSLATLEEYVYLVEKHGIVCNTGNLSEQRAFLNGDLIKTIPNGVYLSSFYSNFPTQSVMDDIFRFIQVYQIKPMIRAVFPLEEIDKAHRLMEDASAVGKIVVSV